MVVKFDGGRESLGLSCGTFQFYYKQGGMKICT